MRLLDHLKTTGETVDEFADRMGEALTTIRKIAYRQRQPSLPLAVKICEATGGVVMPPDLIIEAVEPDDDRSSAFPLQAA